MEFGKGCDVLDARLTELVRRVDEVRRSLSKVNTDRAATCPVPAVEESFGDMAVVVARTLGDVNSRLGKLDEVLRELERARA